MRFISPGRPPPQAETSSPPAKVLDFWHSHVSSQRQKSRDAGSRSVKDTKRRRGRTEAREQSSRWRWRRRSVMITLQTCPPPQYPTTHTHTVAHTHTLSLVAMGNGHGCRLLHGGGRGPAEIREPDCRHLGSIRPPPPPQTLSSHFQTWVQPPPNCLSLDIILQPRRVSSLHPPPPSSIHSAAHTNIRAVCELPCAGGGLKVKHRRDQTRDQTHADSRRSVVDGKTHFTLQCAEIKKVSIH